MVHLLGRCARRSWAVVGTLILPAASLIGCGSDPTGVDTGSINVTAATTGASLDPDGYVLTVDGVEVQSIGVNSTLTLAGLEPGDHELGLSGLAPNCSVSSANPQTVTVVAGESVSVSFEIECGSVPLEIAYARVGAGGGIFLTTAAGSHTFTLRSNSSSGTVIYGDPTWSPDGNLIAYRETEIVNDFEDFISAIWVVDPDLAGLPVRLTEPSYDGDPAWSPDGTKIAFASGRDGNAEVYVMDADGSNVLNLSNSPSWDGYPAWSPDGTRIAFFTDRDGGGEGGDIYVMDADGTNLVNLTNSPTGTWDDPAWSPDGTKIALVGHGSGNAEVYVMDADGSNLVNLTNDEDDQWGPAWSPDGSRIAFVNNWDIYVMDADGSNLVNLTNSPSQEFGPAWSRSPLGP